MLLKTDYGVINLAHAFEFSYDETKRQLTVWWAMPMPAEADRTELAGLYDTARYSYYKVEPAQWRRVIAAT